MRDLVDCCPDADYDCGDDRPKAKAIGCEVYVGNNLIAKFDPMSDDYAHTNAKKFAELYNENLIKL